ncbi:TPA: hypothetical protein N0F65_010493 [Lagenidium giganteum]|uniref:GAG-pre-integrase domain-containing protein n=1 Tax=Lagenidium giganteum TaxID=4803 RepID=A0AAV2Z5L6_9STRA|nr:TPA: hypothetical protein N0F65_010493 [Lagenidium giganteum]
MSDERGSSKSQRLVANYTAADRVGSLQVWHERLAHINPQYLKMMVDRGLAGKQKRKRHRKKLDRKLTPPNELVFADLLFPGRHNGTRYAAALVITLSFERSVKWCFPHQGHTGYATLRHYPNVQ